MFRNKYGNKTANNAVFCHRCDTKTNGSDNVSYRLAPVEQKSAIEKNNAIQKVRDIYGK